MKGYIYMILAAVCLSTVGIFIKLIGTSTPILTVTFFRLFFGFLFLLLIIPFLDKNLLKVKKTDLRNYAIIGLLLATSHSMYNTAMLIAPISNVALLGYIFPFFAAIFAYIFLKEKINKITLLTMILAFMGIIIINPLNIKYITGNLLALSQAVIYAGVIVFMRYEDKTHPVSTIFWIMLFASIFTFPLAFKYGLGPISIKFIWIILLGVISTGLAYLFYTYGLKKLKAATASMTAMIIEPLSAIILAVIIIRESLHLNVILGGIILIAAGLILEHKRKIFK